MNITKFRKLAFRKLAFRKLAFRKPAFRKPAFRKSVLALQWDRSTLDYLVAESKGDEIRVTAAGTVAHSDDESASSPGEALSQRLQQLGLRKADTLVALSRGQVDVIPLELPPAEDAELPMLVANQVARDAGELADTSVVDFVSLASRTEQTREVFAFAVDNSTLQRVEEECAKASLKPSAVLYRPLASVSLLHRMVPRSERMMMLVTLHGQEVDLSIVRGGQLVYTRTARLGEPDEASDVASQLAVEVRRSLAAASLAVDSEEQHLYVFGARDESEQLVHDLAEELSLPVTLLDPLRTEHVTGSIPERVSRVAPLLGMVHEHFDKAHPVDFLHPKEPPPPPDYVRRGIGYAAVALLLIFAGGYYLRGLQTKKTDEINNLRSALAKVTKRLGKVKQRQAVVDAIEKWDADNVNWLDELYDITQRLPTGEDAMIRRFTVSPGRGGRSVVDMSVQVREPGVVTQLGDKFRAAGHEVKSKRVSEQSSSKDYPWRFDTRVTLRRRAVDEYREELNQVAADTGPSTTHPVATGKQ